MELKALICPQCGASLTVQSTSTNIVKCPKCGSTIHIRYDNNDNADGRKTFVTPDGAAVASAVVPDNFELSASINNRWQSEMIPFTTRIKANDDNGIILFSDSKELYHDVKNLFIKTIIGLVPNHTGNGYTSFKDDEELMNDFVSSVYNRECHLVSKTTLPSFMGTHPDAALEQLKADVASFDSFVEIGSALINQRLESVLYRYESELDNGARVVIFAGMDYEGAELLYGGDLLKGLNLEGIKENLGKIFSETPGLNKLGDTISDVVNGKDKLTFSDMMNGGLIGKAMRRKKENETQSEPSQPIKETKKENEETVFGHSKRRIDQITFGAYRKYACLTLAEREEEALNTFLNFVATLVSDQSMAQRSNELINRKMAEIRQYVAQNQAIVAQKQQQLHALQMETSRKIAEYSRTASDGLMDSWKKKMESDSMISKARSEATLGVDTYTNKYGQDVSVSVGADHVYENQYGDVYGVSGNALDQDVLNDLKWTKIDKK
ncbi:MAG: hypothetical protein K6A70_00285 [Erysipelotrichaceae bacterium]|nr:hypothetical protein [Erysipelotrichaceae bacterium]